MDITMTNKQQKAEEKRKRKAAILESLNSGLISVADGARIALAELEAIELKGANQMGMNKFRVGDILKSSNNKMYLYKVLEFIGTDRMNLKTIGLSEYTINWDINSPIWSIHERAPPQIGDKLISKQVMWSFGPGHQFSVIDEDTTQYKLSSNPHISGWDVSIPKIDIWNWFEIWPGTDSPESEPVKKQCTDHKFVNVSFMQLDMRCKYCDAKKPEETNE